MSIKRKFLASIVLMLVAFAVHAASVTFISSEILADKTKLISQQALLLKNRLVEAQSELVTLQNQGDEQYHRLIQNHTNKQLHNQASLDISVAKSNLDSINIELAESEQTISRIEKEIQVLKNQLNVYSVFGLKIAGQETLHINDLKAAYTNQKKWLELEKEREGYLQALQKIGYETLQLQKAKYARINSLMKSRTILELKERQAQSDNDFQNQQSYWLQRLNTLYAELNQSEAANVPDKKAYTQLQREIFYANENVNFTYLQMLIVRYQDQLQELKISIPHTTSITLLNNATDQVKSLSKQLLRLKELLNTRMGMIEKRKTFLTKAKEGMNDDDKEDLSRLLGLQLNYQTLTKKVSSLDDELLSFRSVLDQALQYELASRQGLPGFNEKAWLDLGAELWLVPTLTYQVAKSIVSTLVSSVENLSYVSGLLLALFELGLFCAFRFTGRLLGRVISGMAEQEFGHINVKRLSIQIIHRNLLDIGIIVNVTFLFMYFGVPAQNADFVVNLALVWLVFKGIISMARICLVETMHDRAGHDVRLYHRLKWTFMIGGLITALTVFTHLLPVIYEVKDIFDRMFLSFLLVVSILLLKAWEMVPGIILPHIDEKRLYLKKVVLLLGLLIPLILLVNSAIGLFGYVNLVLSISWYESIFVIVLVGYLLARDLLIDLMMVSSNLLIAHVVNGWLWTEAFLKPLDKVLRVGLFLMAWAILFIVYGWNQQSPVFERLNTLLQYPLLGVLNTTITPLSMIELAMVVSFLFWGARWTREFVYRLLASRTSDLGLRNSLAIFSQYAMIIVGVLTCLHVLGIDLKTLTFVATAFSIGVGFGLRDLFNNFVCGFLLLIERPLRVGDTVTIGGFEGDVTNIGGRAVTIRTWDHLEVLVPNAEIFSKSFTNWTGKDYIVRTVISLKISRSDKPHEIQSLIHQVLADNKDVLADPMPEVLLKEMDEALIEFEVRYFINLRQVKSRIVLRSEILLSIWESFDKHGVHPPYPHHEVQLKGLLPMLPPVYERDFQTT